MKKNCLITQLKATVDNSSLLKFGEMRVRLNYANAKLRIAAVDDPIKVSILTAGVTFTNSGAEGTTEQTVTIDSTKDITVSAVCELSIVKKYNVYRFMDMTSAYVIVNISDFAYSNLREISLGSSQCYGNINGFKESTSLMSLSIVNSNKIEGNIEDLPTAPELTTLRLRANGSKVNDCNIIGDIANLSTKTPNAKTINLDGTNVSGNVSVFGSGFSDLKEIRLSSSEVQGNISAFANKALIEEVDLYGTSVVGNLGELLVGTPKIKHAWLPTGVEWTDADAATADARMQANGGTLSPSSGHYFAGGTRVDSY